MDMLSVWTTILYKKEEWIMTLPVRENKNLSPFNEVFNDMFGNFFDNDLIRSDVLAGDDNTLYIDVPGFNSDNLDVNYYNGMITVEGTNEKGRTITKKIKLSRFQREPIDAKVEDGVLTLTFDEQSSGKKKIKLTNK